MSTYGTLPCSSADASVLEAVTCIFSTYPMGEGLTSEEFESILAQNFALQSPNGSFTWQQLGATFGGEEVQLNPYITIIEGGTMTAITPQQAYDMFIENGLKLHKDNGLGSFLVSQSSYDASSVPSHIAPYLEGHFIEALGCTDPTSENFNAEANTDDGSCYYMGDAGVELGCKNQNALNYNPSNDVSACEDCCVMDYVGCTNATATNFDPVATEPCVNCCEFLEDTTTTTTNTTVTIDDEEWYEDTTTLAMIGGGVLAVGLLVWAFKK